jgi:hypothetical protein
MFFLRPLKAIESASGFDLSFQPRKRGLNIGDPKAGLIKTAKLAAILNDLLQSGEWEGEFETLDDDGTVAQVTMKIEKA